MSSPKELRFSSISFMSSIFTRKKDETPLVVGCHFVRTKELKEARNNKQILVEELNKILF